MSVNSYSMPLGTLCHSAYTNRVNFCGTIIGTGRGGVWMELLAANLGRADLTATAESPRTMSATQERSTATRLRAHGLSRSATKPEFFSDQPPEKCILRVSSRMR